MFVKAPIFSARPTNVTSWDSPAGSCAMLKVFWLEGVMPTG
jgi:hypothetical protein